MYTLPVLILLLASVVATNAFFVTWRDLHHAAATQSLTEFHDTIVSVMATFPCEECREHFSELVQKHPYPLPYVRSRDDMRIWMWMTHNLVNVRLNKTWESYDILTRSCMAPPPSTIPTLR